MLGSPWRCLLMVVSCGCIGTLGEAPERPPTTTPPTTAPPPVTSPPTMPPPASACATAPAYGLRRLTRFEYENTVRDLLGETNVPRDGLPDDALEAHGFDNFPELQNVTDLHVGRYASAARSIAQQAVANPAALLACDVAAQGEETCACRFAATFARQAYRRPLEPDEGTRLCELFKAERKKYTFAEALEQMVTAVLQSASFLYRLETGASGSRLGSHTMASRLAYLLWGSMPDRELAAAADADQLRTDAQLQFQVERMLKDPRARRGVGRFFDLWLRLEKLPTLEKDRAVYPSFSPQVAEQWRQEATAFVGDVVLGNDSRLGTLLTAPMGQRAGLLTQPGFLAVHAHPNQSSPVQRGVFVREYLLCQPIKAPPDIDFEVPEPGAGLTTRQRFEMQTSEPSCGPCHRLINPVGGAFENYDGVGAFRTHEEGLAIDARGELLGTDVDGKFEGAAELMGRLARSDAVRSCLVTSFFRWGYARDPDPQDACALKQIETAFRGSGDYRLRDLLVALTRTPAFLNHAETIRP